VVLVPDLDGGSSGPVLTQKDLKNKKNISLCERKNISFNLANKSYLFRVVKIGEENVSTEFFPKHQFVSFLVGQEKKFDILGDGFYDVSVKLDSINRTDTLCPNAVFVVREIREKIIDSTNQNRTVDKIVVKDHSLFYGLISANRNKIWWILILIAVIVISFDIFYKKLKEKDEGYSYGA